MSQATPITPPTPPVKPMHWGNRLAVLATAALVLIPLSFALVPSEIARWHLAAAQEALWSEDYSAALAQMDKAIDVDPGNTQLWLSRAEMRRSQGDITGAFEDIKVAEAQAGYLPGVRLQAVIVATAARKRELAKAELMALEKLTQTEHYYGAYDNELAYFKALNDFDLETALKQSNSAIERFRSQLETTDPVAKFLVGIFGRESSGRDLYESGLIDTRGMVLLRMGKPKEALVDFDQAIALGEPVLLKKLATVQHEVVDVRQLKLKQQAITKNIAILRYHRALALEKAAKIGEAVIELQRIRNMGITPDSSLF